MKKAVLVFYLFFQLTAPICLKSQNRNLDSLNNVAEDLFEKEKYDEALKYCNLILAKNKNHFSSLLLRASIYTKTGNHLGAINDYSEIIEKDKNNQRAGYYGRGLAYQYLGKYREAAINYGELIRDNPQKENGWGLRGYMYLKLGNIDSAYADLSKAIKLCNSKSFITEHYSSVLLERGMYDSAFFYLNRTLEFEPNNAEAHVLKSRYYKHFKNDILVEKELESAISIDRNNYNAWVEAANYYLSKNSLVNLKEASQKIIELKPKNPMGYFYLSQAYSFDYDSAFKYVNISIEKSNNKLGKGFLYRGICYKYKFKFDLALKDFMAANKLGINTSDILISIAECYSKIGKTKDAEQYYDNALKLCSNCASGYIARANFYSTIKKNTEAESDFKTALTVNGNDSTIYENFISFYRNNKKYKEAITVCDLAITAFEQNGYSEVTVNFKLCKAYYYLILSQYKQAINEIETIKTFDLSKQVLSELYKSLACFGEGDFDNFKKQINSFKEEYIYSSTLVFQTKLTVLIMERKFQDFVDLQTKMCDMHSDMSEFFTFFKNPFKENKKLNDSYRTTVEMVTEKYMIIKQGDSNIVISASFVIDSAFKEDVYKPLLLILSKKIVEFPKKEIPLLIKAQLEVNMNDKNAINTFNDAIKINPKYGLAYFLRGKYKQDKLKDTKGSELDFEKAKSLIQ